MDNSGMASEMGREIDSGVRKTTSLGKTIQKGFTLVELLIVVIILAILAAIVVPQFSASTDDAKLSALDSNLAALRSSINYYYQQHGEYPSTMIATSCTTSTVTGTATVGHADNFSNQLTTYTSSDGLVCGARDTTYTYGPYLRKMPENPLTGISTVRVVTTGALAPTGSATPAGWLFDSVSGRIVADDAANDDR